MKTYCILISLFWFIRLGQAEWQSGRPNTLAANFSPAVSETSVISYSKSLRFNIHTFSVATADSGAVRDLTVKAYRGELLLTNFRTRIDGAVTGADVADLDQNRFPELYVYTASDGSGSFGQVYAWQFLPDRKAPIQVMNWKPAATTGYMGHDSLWVEHGVLCRKYPVYRPGDVNAYPTGGVKLMRYQLSSAGKGFSLLVDKQANAGLK